ncbi:hypothetical protein BST20_09355 [Mycobacterium branderi]|uniref:DUF4239 domain-containing protein n=1 Tax=Mycobacterium branderi TaxID=43348 RepID=A0A7I7W406_9MYCO|nr:DUF4239 domain-containing protein [Mycobacterium branderi]ORA39691.1 hypothetical protein BST20_09355 [Mycobacterium branderi]BBZ11727.1 hypothetical protein MBRA_19220 [Mycobacterium branderi]
MIWVLQLPAPLVASLVVVLTVGVAVAGLVLWRRIFGRRVAEVGSVSDHVFELAGVLYAVLVAFVVVVVWEQFDQAQSDTESEAVAISDLLRDSEGLPAPARRTIQQNLIAYTNDVVDDEFPRMRHGGTIEQQSEHLTRVWQSFLQVQPVTQSEISFYRQSISKLDDLGSARKTRISSSQSEIPGEMWVLLLGGALVMLIFTYMETVPNVVHHGVLIALASALLAFVLYLIFAMEHPFVGTIAVSDDPYVHVLDTWSHLASK